MSSSVRDASSSPRLYIMQDALQVAQGLEEIALLAFTGVAKFKVKAYEHAAQVVETLGGELLAGFGSRRRVGNRSGTGVRKALRHVSPGAPCDELLAQCPSFLSCA